MSASTQVLILEQELRKRLKESDKLISLLNSIRDRDHHLATESELFQLKKILHVRALDNNIIPLVMETIAREAAQHNNRYQPLFLTRDALTQSTLDYKINQLLSKNKPFRYDCIIKTMAHCSPLQLQFDGQSFSVYYLDAGLDGLNHDQAVSWQEQAHYAGIYTSGGIQTDASSCAVFSIEHLYDLSWCSTTDKQTIHHAEQSKNPLLLSPVFLKHSQRTFKPENHEEHYFNRPINEEGTKTIGQHLDEHCIYVDDAGSIKKRNYSIEYAKNKYLHAAYDLLQQLKTSESPEFILELLDKRKSVYNKNALQEDEEASEEQLNNDMLMYWIQQNNMDAIHPFVDELLAKKSTGMIDYLLDLGATFKHIDSPKRPPITWAMQTGHIVFARRLLSLSDDKDKDNQGNYYVHRLADVGFASDHCNEILDMLIEHHSDLTAQDHLGNTALHLLASKNNLKSLSVMQRLIELGLTVHSQNKEGYTPLSQLFYYNRSFNKVHDQLVELLLQADAKQLCSSFQPKTPSKHIGFHQKPPATVKSSILKTIEAVLHQQRLLHPTVPAEIILSKHNIQLIYQEIIHQGAFSFKSALLNSEISDTDCSQIISNLSERSNNQPIFYSGLS
jgi:ankyrin repeat protein